MVQPPRDITLLEPGNSSYLDYHPIDDLAYPKSINAYGKFASALVNVVDDVMVLSRYCDSNQEG
jgi:hypothetical protein